MLDIQKALENTKSFVVPVEDIRVLSRDTFQIGNDPQNRIKVSSTAFKDLLQIVGLTQKTVFHINSQLHRTAGFALIKELMKAMSKKSGMKVAFLVDVQTKEVKRICLDGEQGGARTALSADTIEELISYACEKSNKVKLADTFISDGGTKVTFNIRWDVAIPLQMRGEDVKFGKQITWDLLGDTLISDFAERLICTNGMTGIVPTKPIPFGPDTSPSDWYKMLFEDLINPDQERIKDYENKVFRAMQTNLSVFEFNSIKALLLNHWKDDMDKIVKYLGQESWKSQYKGRGIDLEKATIGQLRNCPTPVNAWDAINCLTDLASHTYNSSVPGYVKKNTQKKAGRLLNKTWDEDQQLYNVPTFKNKGPQASF